MGLFDKKSREKAPPLYWAMHDTLAPPLRLVHNVKTINEENLPAEGQGGCIIAGMHNGALDAMFIATAAERRGRAVRWVGDEGICNAPVVGPVIRNLGVIPIASHHGKGTDPEKIKAALSEARDVIDTGGTVGIFPEGVIHPFYRGKKPMPFKTGIIRLAIETGAPIIPAWAKGVGAIFPWLKPVTLRGGELYLMAPLWTPSPVTIYFGEPFEVDAHLDISASKDEIRRQCRRLELAFEDLVYDRREDMEDWLLD
mgnify:CR=1 FL=1